MKHTEFSFQNLDIWNDAVEMGDLVFGMADLLEEKKLFRFAEQLRGAGMSISGNIAEGCGCSSINEFARFLHISKLSTFEIANILLILNRRNLLDKAMIDSYLERLDVLGRKITDFQKNLNITEAS